MTDSTTTLPWLVVREDGNGNRYRVGRYATRAEAQRLADSLDDRNAERLYCVERLEQPSGRERNGTVRNGSARNGTARNGTVRGT
ncbi:SPOR domain-containing protein [Streptomyces beihaiensis]|uniref:SPOR domain-containing protein n=1 Tax=Streptomyces beihaiensis TaxID=2984495 RepID=A0ABT3TYE9_9ACTN|nr:SPOR domain-containing protein [Streptomyces beihaiensis]MCX3062072.1 SPOR domain-containing protein [Streptomyces beihaiensis]